MPKIATLAHRGNSVATASGAITTASSYTANTHYTTASSYTALLCDVLMLKESIHLYYKLHTSSHITIDTSQYTLPRVDYRVHIASCYRVLLCDVLILNSEVLQSATECYRVLQSAIAAEGNKKNNALQSQQCAESTTHVKAFVLLVPPGVSYEPFSLPSFGCNP